MNDKIYLTTTYELLAGENGKSKIYFFPLVLDKNEISDATLQELKTGLRTYTSIRDGNTEDVKVFFSVTTQNSEENYNKILNDETYSVELVDTVFKDLHEKNLTRYDFTRVYGIFAEVNKKVGYEYLLNKDKTN